MIDFSEVVERYLWKGEEDRLAYAKRDPGTIDAHTIGFCKRQLYLSKLGLEERTTEDLGRFKTGTLIHDWLEEHMRDDDEIEDVALEEYFDDYTVDGITFHGRADAYEDGDDEAVYDVKTRSNWYRFDPPKQRHIDQVLVYMKGFGADKGQIVYVSKKDMEVRRWPADFDDVEGDFFEFDEERFAELVDKCKEVKAEIIRNGIATCEEEIPFEKCGCFICENEEVRFPDADFLEGVNQEDDETDAENTGNEDESGDGVQMRWEAPDSDFEGKYRQTAPSTAWFQTLQLIEDYEEERGTQPTLPELREYIFENRNEPPTSDLSRMISRLHQKYAVVDRRENGGIYEYRINANGNDVLDEHA